MSNDTTQGNNAGGAQTSILGLATDELANLSVEEIVGNAAAIKMLMHYYKVLSQENGALRTDLNSLKTYVDAYAAKKLDANIAAILQAVGAIFIGLGTNLLTGIDAHDGGWLLVIGGVVAQGVGFYLAMREPK